MSQIPRLFLSEELAEGALVALDGGQAHYLAGVLRLRPGDAVHLLDDATGEWEAKVAEVARRTLLLRVLALRRPREIAPDLWLLVAPLKRQRFEWVIEKACELGVRKIQPVLTRRTVVERLNAGRLRAHMVEAAEQCERTALPTLGEAEPLGALLAGWEAGRVLLFADEEGGERMADVAPLRCPAAILIGPEGGFDAAERASILRLPDCRRLSLGPNILRADTAAVAAIAQFQALAGL